MYSLILKKSINFLIKKNSRPVLIIRSMSAQLHTKRITPNISLLSFENEPKIADSTRPTVVIMAWMMAKGRHLNRYADVYLNKGCDVITVTIAPGQLLWPKSGAQLVAKDLAHILQTRKSPLLVHGFSVGAYVWAEALLLLGSKPEVLDRVAGQVWDSAADFSVVHIGLPYAVFPKSPISRFMLRNYIQFHTNYLFYSIATKHWEKAKKYFYDGALKAPALILISKIDPIGTVENNMDLKQNWDKMGIKTYVKCWEKSAHVSHFHKYPEEYKDELNTFLENINFPPIPKAKL